MPWSKRGVQRLAAGPNFGYCLFIALGAGGATLLLVGTGAESLSKNVGLAPIDWVVGAPPISAAFALTRCMLHDE